MLHPKRLGSKQLFPLLFISFVIASKWSQLRGAHNTKLSQTSDVLLRLLYYVTFMTPVINLCQRTRHRHLTTLYLIAATLYLPTYLDGSERRGGRNIQWFKRMVLWGSATRKYFNLKLVRTAALDSQQHYVFGLHPHAIGPYGSILNLHTDANKFSQVFPNIRIKTLAASILFYVPLVRDLWLALGFVDASRSSAMYVLQQNKHVHTLMSTVDNGHNAILPRERSSSADIRALGNKLVDQNGTPVRPQSHHARKPTTHYDEKGVYVDPLSLPACTTFSATTLHSDLGVTINSLPKRSESPRAHSPPSSMPGSPQRSRSPEPNSSSNTGGSQVHGSQKSRVAPSPLLLPSSRSGQFTKSTQSPGVQYNHVPATTNGHANSNLPPTTPTERGVRNRTNSTATTIQSSPSFNSLRSLSNLSNGSTQFSPASSPRHITNSSSNVSVSGSTSTSSSSASIGANGSSNTLISPKQMVRRTLNNQLPTIAQHNNNNAAKQLSADSLYNSGVGVFNDDSFDNAVTSVAVFVGGKKECLLTNPPRSKQQSQTVVYTLYLRKRKGFIRLALQTGAHLVPVFTFGDSLAHTQLMYADLSEAKKVKPTPATKNKPSFDDNDSSDTQQPLTRSPSFIVKGLRRLNQLWYNVFGVPLPIVKNVFPHRCNIVTIVGKPITVRYTAKPTDREIDDLHKHYIDELTKLFYENREKYASTTGSSSVLRII